MIPILLLLLASPGPAAGRTPSGCVNVPIGGGFEGGTGGPWTESSSNGVPIICTTATCGTGGGTVGPRSGLWWAWLGGVSGPAEDASISQSVALAPGYATLSFYLWNGASSGNGSDRFNVLMDTAQQFAVTEGDPAYTGGYAQVELDVSQFADGGSHSLKLHAATQGLPGVTSFSLDDVSLQHCPLPSLSVDDATVTEGNAGTTNAVFTVSLSQTAPAPVLVSYATGVAATGVAATPGSDYTAVDGILTFAPGVASQTLAVPVLGDTLDEPDETFALTLSSPTGAVLDDASGLGTITDDDPIPTLSVADVTQAEGNAGTTGAAFTVSLSAASGLDVTVAFATADGSAAAGLDYTAASGTLTIPAGASSSAVTVQVRGDTLDEPDETFALNLSAPTNAVLGDASGLGTITDDDPPPALSIGDVTLAEGDAGTTSAVFTVSLSAVSGRDVTLAFVTANGTAVAGLDYTTTSGTLTIPAGASSATLAVPVKGDTLDETDETFFVNLSTPVNATLADGQGRATILDDDGPAIAIGDVSVTEGNAGTVDAVFSVTLSAPSPQTVSVDHGASDGTATGGLDYLAAAGTLSFAPGATSRTLTVLVLGDVLDEPDETFFVALSGAVHARLGDAFGLGRILDDDGGTIALGDDLVHGSMRRADLAALPGPTPDRDIYLLERPPHSSFDVVVDGTSGDVGSGNGPLLQRLAPDLTTVLQDSVPAGAGSSRSLRMENALAVPVVDYVQVRSAGCDVDCDGKDVYRIRAWETTGSIPRFNNAGSQVTVLVLANRTPDVVSGNVWFWDGGGTLLGSSSFTLLAQQALALNTATVPGVAGQTGAISVSHDGPYGALTGKAVAVEPSTGFAFDTPLLWRVR